MEQLKTETSTEKAFQEFIDLTDNLIISGEDCNGVTAFAQSYIKRKWGDAKAENLRGHIVSTEYNHIDGIIEATIYFDKPVTPDRMELKVNVDIANYNNCFVVDYNTGMRLVRKLTDSEYNSMAFDLWEITQNYNDRMNTAHTALRGINSKLLSHK